MQYFNILLNELPKLLEEVLLQIRSRMWFQLDGLLMYFDGNIRTYSKNDFAYLWIGRGSSVPPRSLDLTPVNYYFWEHMKAKFNTKNPKIMKNYVIKLTKV